MRNAFSWLGLLSGVLLLACSTPVSTTRAVSQAELAVNDAAASEADTLAPADLQLARSKLAQAEQASRNGQHVYARRLAEQALVDAQVAEAKAESEAAGVSARELGTRIDYFQRSLPPER